MSASENEAQKNAIHVEARRAKSSHELLEQAVASTNNSDAHNMADKNASDCTAADAISTDTDMTVDLIDFTDGVVELTDCRESDAGGQSDDLIDDSGVGLYNTSFDLPSSGMTGDTPRCRVVVRHSKPRPPPDFHESRICRSGPSQGSSHVTRTLQATAPLQPANFRPITAHLTTTSARTSLRTLNLQPIRIDLPELSAFLLGLQNLSPD